MMLTDRNLYAFVTLCCCLCLVRSMPAATAIAEVVAVPVQSAGTTATSTAATAAATQQDEVNASPDAATVRTFSPRIDYNNEWRPLGHGDPLKNDPTYDYSPPALERVRYWAENGSNGNADAKPPQDVPQDVLRNKTKSEILLLGVSNERVRGKQAAHPQLAPANTRAYESPLLQPKYTTIRRSYYAQPHHMPHTHLMPPPMQQLQQQQHQQMLLKHMAAASGDYRQQHMPVGAGYMAPTSTAHMQQMFAAHAKPQPQPQPQPHYSSAPWQYTSSSTTHPAYAVSTHAYDVHHQAASMQHYNFVRPLASVATTQSHIYAPNAIHSHAGVKPSMAPRKPWLHELLRKEVVKPAAKPISVSSNKYVSKGSSSSSSTKPYYEHRPLVVSTSSSTYAPLSYTPVSFVSGPPTLATYTSSSTPATTTTTKATTTATKTTTSSTPAAAGPSSWSSTTAPTYNSIYITPTPAAYHQPQQHPLASSDGGFRPMHMYSGSSSTYAPPAAATSTMSNRLLIPNVSNLAQRPTVAPIELTTDALFKHYKQPKKPLLGPMYLIIEGHSKVKTYGQNELDPHQPKIVPIIPKREPIVRVADPNEKQRGTVETFQVKHLHTTSTTPMPKTTTAAVPATTTTTTTKTTTTTTTTTRKPTTTKSTTSSNSVKPVTTKLTNAPTTSASLATAPPATPSPPTGMQDLLSLLDFFADNSETSQTTKPATRNQTATTQLKPVKAAAEASIAATTPATTTKLSAMPSASEPEPEPEPRIGSQADTIASLLDDAADEDQLESEFATTELPPRGIRQIFDYDQLPESRLKELLTLTDDAAAYDDYDTMMDDDAVQETEEQVVDTSTERVEAHKIRKRIDSSAADDADAIRHAREDDDDADADAEESNEFEEFDELAADLENVT